MRLRGRECRTPDWVGPPPERLPPLQFLPALTDVKESFQKDISDIFSGTVEVDETYIGAQWNHKRHRAKAAGSKRGRGRSNTPVFGILGRGGKVWAQVVSDVEARTLLPPISRRVELGSPICSESWKS
ncbi:MAG: transposase [Candidatus Poribacteria bacterium]|nr:transposase [Candidatus Poribacteria bacterium]MDP6748324.1 transposase [Candidatus Poribacteria bacterium]